MLRRLEDRIRELCAKSITAGEDEMSIIADLKAALREHIERVRNIVAATGRREKAEVWVASLARLLPVLWRKPVVLLILQVVELAHELIEHRWVFFYGNPRAQRVHLLSFFRRHLEDLRMHAVDRVQVVPVLSPRS